MFESVGAWERGTWRGEGVEQRGSQAVAVLTPVRELYTSS